jgi:hypothetical protein
VPLSIDGPKCSCGATGCWEAYVSNLATLSRYFGSDLSDPRPRDPKRKLSVEDLIARARAAMRKRSPRSTRPRVISASASLRSSTHSIPRAFTSAAKSRQRGA